MRIHFNGIHWKAPNFIYAKTDFKPFTTSGIGALLKIRIEPFLLSLK